MKRIFSLILTLLLIVTFPLNSIAEVVFYDTNHIGSPVAMWDKNGKKVWEGEYYPFGKEKDEETGLTYFGARYMDEKTGRFITPDPVRTVDASSGELNQQILFQPQRLNRYSYSLNNPYRYVDPDGRDPHQWADGNYSDNDGQENPGLYAQHKKAQSQVGQGIRDGWDYHPAVIVGIGSVGISVAGIKSAITLAAKGAKASMSGTKLLGTPIKWSGKDIAKVISKHGPDLSGKGGVLKSRFFSGEDIAKLITSGTHQNAVKQVSGKNYERVFDVGRNIGFDVKTGKPTSTMTIVTQPSGRLVTAFPGTP